MNHSGQQRQETLHHNPWKEQELERQVRMLLPCCVIWGKPHNLSGSACQRGSLVLASCACPVGLCKPPPKPPHRGAARPSCLLEAPLAAGRRQPWPPLLPASFLSHFSASGQALRAPEAKT